MMWDRVVSNAMYWGVVWSCMMYISMNDWNSVMWCIDMDSWVVWELMMDRLVEKVSKVW